MLNPLNGCNLKFVDNGAFRCKKAYIKIYSASNQQLTLIEQDSSSGFNFEKFIPKDFCFGGIEIGYDIVGEWIGLLDKDFFMETVS